MKRTLKLAAAAAVLGLVAALAPALAAPAMAAPGDPIDPVYDLPSSWRGAGSGGTLDPDDAIIRKYEIDLARSVKSPKPAGIGLMKGLGVLGIAQAVGMGVGVSSELGVSLYAVMNGTTIDQARCAMPDWYNGAVGIVSLGMMGSCQLEYLEPNADVPVSVTLTYQGQTARITGRTVNTTFGGDVTCMLSTGPVSFPSGTVFRYLSTGSGGVWGQTQWPAATPETSGWCKNVGRAYGGWVEQFQVAVLSTGEVVASSVEASGDPERKARCAVGIAGGGEVVSEWVTYTEGTGFPSAGVDAACSTATKNLAPGTIESVAIETEDHLGTRERTVEVDVPAEHDPNAGRKSLVLFKVLPTGDLLPCMSNPAECAEWFEESFGENGDESGYRCLYGDTVMDLDECAIYRPTFRPGEIPQIQDPVTGETIPWGKTPYNSTDPSTGPSPGAECMGGWGQVPDPISWVLHPLKCFAVWATVPNPSTLQQQQTRIKESWEKSTPGKLAISITALGPALDGIEDGGCGGLILPAPTVLADGTPGTEDRAFLAACEGDFFEPWAPPFFWFISGTCAIFGFFAIRGMLNKLVGFA